MDSPNQPGKIVDLAARIADGSAIDWTGTDLTEPNPDDRALLDALHVVADIATLHRTPDGWSADATQPAPTTWGSLTVQSVIGRGRFGEVYLAWDARLQQRRALKLLHLTSPSMSSPTQAIDEARLLARVRHPNVLAVYGAECLNDQVGIWTEFIEGRTLESILSERGPFDPEEVIAIGRALCGALAAVHEAGLLHRDVKAHNVMRETGGRVVLMDFGTGHDLALAPPRSGDMTGTPLYLAPEILAGGVASRASDIYALGVLLFHLLTSTHPVEGKTLEEVRDGHRRSSRRRLRDLRPDLSADLINAVDRAVAPRPSARFDSAGDFETALRRASNAGRTVDATPWDQTSFLRVSHGLASIGILVAIVIAATLATLLSPSPRSRAPADPSGSFLMPQADNAGGRPRRLPELEQSRYWGRPSHDGRYLPFLDLDGDLWIWGTSQGETHRVKQLGPHESIEFPIMSPDGTRVAYASSTPRGEDELRVIDVDGTRSEVLISAAPGDIPIPLDWSRDGRILCAIEQSNGDTQNGDTQLVMVGPGGSKQALQTLQRGAPKWASLSPDGRWVVYDFPKGPQSAKRDVLIAETDGGPQRRLIGGPANNLMPSWAPDGHSIFYISDQSGSMDGWLVPVDGGHAGDPVHVASQLGRVSPIGLTDDGRFYYTLQTNWQDVYTETIDESGAHASTRARVSRNEVGGHLGPAWSRDGRFLAYITASGSTALDRDSKTLTIREVGTGRVVPLSLPMRQLGNAAPRWSRDGRSLIVRGNGLDDFGGLHRVDLDPLRFTTIMAFNPSRTSDYGAFDWAPDGQRLFYIDRHDGIIERDLRSGRQSTIVSNIPRHVDRSLVVSPDGTMIAFSSVNPGEDPDSFLEFVDLNGGRRQVVTRLAWPEAGIVQAWTPDNRRLLYTIGKNRSDAPHQLWSIDIAGGDPRDMGLSIHGNTAANKLALSPDGSRLAFTEGVVDREVWVMSGFLPQ